MSLREITLKLAPSEEYFFRLSGNFLSIRTAANTLQVRDASNHLGDIFTMKQGESAEFVSYFQDLAIKNLGVTDDSVTVVIGRDAVLRSF